MLSEGHVFNDQLSNGEDQDEIKAIPHDNNRQERISETASLFSSLLASPFFWDVPGS